MITAYFSSVLEDSVEIFFTDVTCIVIKAATNKEFLQLNLTNTKHLNGNVYFIITYNKYLRMHLLNPTAHAGHSYLNSCAQGS